MSGEKNTTVHAGAGAASLLGVLFIGLKLTGYIDWSWWWVTAPFWGQVALFVLIVAIYVGVALTIEEVRMRRARRANAKQWKEKEARRG